ncbi:MAG TPA: fimbrial assembly protein [Pantoea sp.]|nr:fimbrial assembly protein [Pantoea sp.]
MKSTITLKQPRHALIRRAGAPRNIHDFTYSKAAYCVALTLAVGVSLQCREAAAEVYFNPAALEISDSGQAASDLSQFLSGDNQLPGKYRVDIYVNGQHLATRDVNFIASKDQLLPEFTPAQLSAMGVKTEAFPGLASLPQDQPVSDLASVIPDAASHFDFNQQRLDVSIPQAALNVAARSTTDSALWDQGMTSAQLNYRYSGANTQYGNARLNSNFLNLRGGLNLGAWRLRNYSTFSSSTQQAASWQSISTYLQRDIQFLKGQLTLGDSATPGDVFESVQFRGAQITSDENMLPDSLRGFAPVIRGIAQSNAQVTVRQNGYVIYQTYVAPGAFVIRDLYPTASSGDLEVVVREADGSERVSVQPFSAVPIMQREGQLKYSATTGRYRSTYASGSPPGFAQATALYGLPGSNTLYGGVQGANHYHSAALGVGHSFGDWGSVSVDVTQAQTQLRDGSAHRGQSYRFQYAKEIAATGTSFTLAGYRYSTSGFYSLQEANEVNASQNDVWRLRYNKRSQAMLNINQSFFGIGSFYVAASQQDYWQQSGKERNISVGYSATHRGINYGLNYTHSQTPGVAKDDRQIAFNLQIPLDKLLSGSWARYGMSHSQNSGTSHSVGLAGTTLQDNNLNYLVQQNYDRRGQGYGGDVNATYKASVGEIDAGYNYSRNSRQVNYGAQGSIVAHPYGVTLGQAIGDSAIVVRAPGASGVSVQNNTGVKTDWRGYAVIPYATPYRYNRVALDTNTYGEELDIDSATATVVPTKGALVLAEFKTRVGSRALITLTRHDGLVPFGASAHILGDNDNSSIVGEGGQVYLSGVAQRGVLEVKWGNSATQQCQADFTLPLDKQQNSAIKHAVARCK